MIGIVLCGTSIGKLVAPLMANRMIAAYGWRMSYMLMGIVVFVTIIISAQFFKSAPAPEKTATGTATGLKIAGQSLKKAWGSRPFWIIFVMLFCLGFARSIPSVHIVPYALTLNISEETAASILATVGGLSILGRVVLGGAADRMGSRYTFIICFGVFTVIFLWLLQMKSEWSLYLFAAVFGFANAGVGASETSIVAQYFGLGSIGLISGVMGVAMTMGGAAGPFSAGYIFDFAGRYEPAFLVCAAISIAGLILILLLKPARANAQKA